MSHPRPQAGTPGPYEFPRATRFALANGLRVIVAPMHRLPLVSVIAVVDAGAAGDAPGREGLAMLTAAALAEGTVDRDGPALTEAFERIGTAVDSGAEWDDATVQLTVTPARFDEAMALLADVVTAPRFADGDVERLKAERLAELLQQQVEPRGLADERFARVVYAPTSRYAHAAGGSPDTVRALDATRVRAWHALRYGSATTTLIVAGDVTPEAVHAVVERRFGAWSRSVEPTPAVRTEARTTDRAVHVVAKADAPQSELRVGHVGLPRSHRDYFSAVVMNAVLGGLFSSRINLNLREVHAYTYGAHSGFDWRRAAGPFVVATAVKTEVTDAAVREILLEIDRIRDGEVTADELDLATKYLAGVFPIRYETTGAVASALAVSTVYGLPEDYFSTYRDRIAAVTRGDVLTAARTHLHPEQLQILA
ncbi:MAG: pitrilysin family protein, partial [Gemmatimonadaceae bacterium]|nr:pitrilysin family protein [Gemmatimonadaceae bacterium]